MTTLLGLDYAGGRPGGLAIWNEGYRFVCRYLTPGGAGLPGKLLTKAELDDLLAHGIAVACNFETTADRMKGGHDAGSYDAKVALQAMNSLGIPSDRPCYFSADWDVTTSEQQLVDAYLRAAADVIGYKRVGVYGGYWTIKRCLDNCTACWAWQTGAWSPRSNDPDRHLIDPRVHIYQRVNSTAVVNGVSCDINESRQADFGQFPGGDDVSAEDVWFGVQVNNAWGQPVHAIDIINGTEHRAANIEGKCDHLTTRIDETANAIIAFEKINQQNAAGISAQCTALTAELTAIKTELDEIKTLVSAPTTK